MPPVRHVKQPKLSSTKRTASDTLVNAKIDSALKELRSCSRQLSAFDSSLQDELRMLERLYYKGVNQHRSALFWKKVKEIRRLGQRLLEVQLLAVTDDLRYSFYVDENSERNPKILKGAWHQIPSVKYVDFVLERVQSSLQFSEKARERFAGAYHSFTLVLQTGAFLQMILTFAALVSRLDALVGELQTTLETLSTNLYLLLQAMGVNSHRVKAKLKKEEATATTEFPPTKVVEESIVEEILNEDLGSTIIRKGTATEHARSSAGDSTSLEAFWQQGQFLDVMDNTGKSSAPPAPSLIFTSPVKQVPSTLTVSKRTTETDLTSKAASSKKAKKKKRDAIDDIFGSL